jgi:uncharacterized protein DUF5681
MNSHRSDNHRPGAGRPFKKGQSGNPGGRPKEVAHVKELARQHTEKAVATLVAIMGNPDEPAAARARAAEVLLNRAWGTPEHSASVSLDGPLVIRWERE